MLCLFTSLPSPMAHKKHPQVICDEINSARAKAIEAALEDIYTHGLSLRKASLKYGIPASTLSEFNAAKAHFTAAEATILVDWILSQLQWGFPFTHSKLWEKAEVLLAAKSHTGTHPPLGTQWSHTFIAKHGSWVSTHYSSSLDNVHAKAVNPTSNEHWFNLIQDVLAGKFSGGRVILVENMYNMDESGFIPSLGTVHKVFGPHGAKIVKETVNGDRELISVICTICADGSALVPTTIFKGKNYLASWGVDDPECNTSGSRFVHVILENVSCVK